MGTRKQSSDGEIRSYISGLILGFVVSVPLAAWLSPRSGEATRSEIRQRGVIVRRKAGEAAQKVGQLPGQLGGQIGQQVGQLQEKAGLKEESVEDAIAQGQAIAARKAAERDS